MTIETMTSVSYTRLTTWQDCPRRFKFRYVDEAPEEGTAVNLVFGTAMHEAAEAFLESLAQTPKGDDEIIAVFERAFRDSVKFAEESQSPLDCSPEELEALVEKGKAMLRCFTTKVDRNAKVVGTELAFDVEVQPGVALTGYLDCLLMTGLNQFKIVELKTAARTYGEDRLRFDLQPTCYMAAAQRLLPPGAKVEFEYWLMMKTKEPDLKFLPVVRSDQDHDELHQLIRDYLKAIGAQVFPRRRSYQCDGCGYAKLCAESRQ
jgi:putative RecB family exonuclease